MKTHTTKGANILRPVAQLKDMIPGIELHHESLDGRGYPRAEGCGDSVAAAHYRRGRHIRRAHHKPALPAGARSRICAADHPQSLRQATRSHRGCRSDRDLRTRRNSHTAAGVQVAHRCPGGSGQPSVTPSSAPEVGPLWPPRKRSAIAIRTVRTTSHVRTPLSCRRAQARLLSFLRRSFADPWPLRSLILPPQDHNRSDRYN